MILLTSEAKIFNCFSKNFTKFKGLNFLNFKIFISIFETEINGCTENSLQETTLLSKKIINSTLTSFLVEGLIFIQKETDTKEKRIYLTDKGTKLANDILPTYFRLKNKFEPK